MNPPELQYSLWDLKYAMLCQRIIDQIPFDMWTPEEKELYRYCIKEGFFEEVNENNESNET